MGAGAEHVTLGEIVGVFGFKGEVRLFLDNPASELLDRPLPVILEGPDGARREARLSARSGAGKRVIGRVVGVDDEADAKALLGHRILVRTADLPAPAEDELYVWQLEGAEVHIGDAVVGRVVGVQSGGPVAILEIDHGQRDPAFVPLREAFVVRAAPGRVELVAGALDD